LKGRTRTTTSLKVRRISPDGDSRRSDRVVAEEPLEIRVEGSREGTATAVSVTMRTPGHDFELAAGFLAGEGLLRSRKDLKEITYCQDGEVQEYNVVSVRYCDPEPPKVDRLERHFYTSSSCGVCGKASLESVEALGCVALPLGAPDLDPSILASLPDRMRPAQPVFQRTGGIHAAALFEPGGALLLAREDVGRHNAVDKVVGARLLAGEEVGNADCVLVVSGRVSFEIVQKAAMAGIPALVAVGAPTSLAVDLANRFRITLVGFARAGSLNVYADAGRIGGV
jgi:FdhD protein